MYKLKLNELYANELAKYLDLKYIGDNIKVSRPCEVTQLLDNTFCYYDGNDVKVLESIDRKAVVITYERHSINNSKITQILSKSPKLDFFRIVNEFFIKGIPHTISPKALVNVGANVGINVNIGCNSIIDEGVTVGNNTYIGNNVIVLGNVTIGSNCIIKDGAIIGSENFAFINDGDEVMQIPQFGEVTIGDDVMIGANSTIECPLFGKTNISDSVKIDDLVHVGQGVSIDEASQITAGTVIARDVIIGKKCFVGVNSSIKQSITIGNNTFIGMGSVVISNVDGDSTYVGVPAKPL